MEQMLNEIVESGGFGALIVGMAGLLKYALTVMFLFSGIIFFQEKK